MVLLLPLSLCQKLHLCLDISSFSLSFIFWFSHLSIPSSHSLQLHPPSCLTLCLIKEPMIQTQNARRDLPPTAVKVGCGVERTERQTQEDAAARLLASFQTQKSDCGRENAAAKCAALNILDAQVTTYSVNRSPTLHPCSSWSHLHVTQILRFWIRTRGTSSRRTSGGAVLRRGLPHAAALENGADPDSVRRYFGVEAWVARASCVHRRRLRRLFLTLVFFPVLLSSRAPPCCL